VYTNQVSLPSFFPSFLTSCPFLPFLLSSFQHTSIFLPFFLYSITVILHQLLSFLPSFLPPGLAQRLRHDLLDHVQSRHHNGRSFIPFNIPSPFQYFPHSVFLPLLTIFLPSYQHAFSSSFHSMWLSFNTKWRGIDRLIQLRFSASYDLIRWEHVYFIYVYTYLYKYIIYQCVCEYIHHYI
jgi:hypothetical protein